MINESCATKAPASSEGKSHSIPMFDLECVDIASTLRLFWDIVNVTMGFNVQESSSSKLAVVYKIIPGTAIEC